MRLEYFIVAESVSIDQTTNRISFFNVLEQIQALTFPVPLPQFTAVAHWNAQAAELENDYQITFLVTPPGDPLVRFDQNFRMVRERHRTLATISGVRVERTGKMEIEVKLNGEHRASHTIDIVQKPNSED